MRPAYSLLLSLIAVSIGAIDADAQFGGETTYYPEKLYPGENIVTLRNPAGVERIRPNPTRNVSVKIPDLRSCPNEVNISVTLTSAVGDESVEFTVFDCNGRTSSVPRIRSENWTIRHERTGPVTVGGDTCIQCHIETSNQKIVDSIVIGDPAFSVRMPPKVGGRWVAVGNEFRYQVCYRAGQVESKEELIRLYIRRDMPNGGLTQYMIEKPITATGVPPPPPPPPKKVSKRDSLLALLPPRVDPSTFRNIVMPTAEALPKGRFFLANYDIAGWLLGYGVTDQLMVMGGGAYVPEFINSLAVGTVGGKYEALRVGDLRLAVGAQFAYSSIPESNISVAAPYGAVSYGDRENRLSLAAGYSWKRHVTPGETFDRNAFVLGLGGDVTVGRGWKIAAETYIIESSGLAPFAATLRWFSDNLAVDVGFVINVSAGTEVESSGFLSGKIRDLAIAPVISAVWVW